MPSTINADNGVVSGSSGVKTTADTSGVLALQSNGTTGLTLGTDLSVTSVNYISGVGLRSLTAGGVRFYNAGNNNYSYITTPAGTGDMQFETGAGEQMRLTGTGLGIGTTSPTYKLDISVTTNNGIRTTSSAGQQLYLGNTGGDGVVGTLNNYAFNLMSNGSPRFQIGTAGQLGIGGATYGTSGQVLTSGGSGAAPSWATPAAPTAGKLLASVNINSSTGFATITWATTGIKRISVSALGLLGAASGQCYFIVGHTTTPVTASSYYSSSQRVEFNTNANNTYNAQAEWSITSSGTATWYQNAQIEIGLNSSDKPYMVGSMQSSSTPQGYKFGGMYVGTWTTAQFQSLTLWISGGAPYEGRVTVVGYTD